MTNEMIGLLSGGEISDFSSINNNDSNRCPTAMERMERSEETFTESRSLAKVISSYAKGEHLLTLRWELLKQIVLIVVAFSGASIYAVASDAYSLNIGYSSWVMRGSFIGCTCLSVMIVLYNATDIFINQQHSERISVALSEILAPLRTRTQQLLKNVAVGVGAAISALPIALLSFTYPIPNIALPGEILLAIIIEIDNTILHFLPIELALQNKGYRIPILPFEYTYKLITYCRMTTQDRLNRASELEKKRIFGRIKQRFTRQLTQLQKRIAIYGFSFNGYKFSYENQLPREFYFRYTDHDTYSYMESLLRFHHRPYDEPRKNASNSLCRKMNSIFRSLAYVFGAVWVVMGSSGYLVAPINALDQLLASNITHFNEMAVSPMLVASLASAPSIYFFGILLAFFGGNALRDAYDYFVSWNDDDVKIPLQAKLYPKIFLVLMAFNVYIFNFCYAAAVQLVIDNFVGPWWVPLRPFAIWSARTGVIFLSMAAMVDFYRKIIDKIVLYRTRSDNHELVRLNATLEQLKDGIKLMIDEEFLESLSSLSQKQLQMFLDLRHPQDGRDLEMELRSLVSLYFKDAHQKEVTMQLLRKIVSM